MLLQQDFGAFEEELYVVEVEYGGIQGGQNSGGLTCTTECCRKGNLRMDRAVFMSLADELRPFLEPGQSQEDLMYSQLKNSLL